MHTCFADSGEADASSVFNPGGNLSVYGLLLDCASFAAALRAGIADHAPGTLACRASSCDAEKALLIANLPASAARAAGAGSFAVRAAASFAGFAYLVFAIGNSFFCAEDGFFKFNGYVLAQVGTALRTSSPARTTSTKEIAESKELAEDV